MRIRKIRSLLLAIAMSTIAFPSGLSAQSVHGPTPGRVYQRNADGTAAIAFEIRDIPSAATKLKVEISSGNDEFYSKEFDAAPVIKGEAEAIPTGGPYHLTMTVYTSGGVLLERSIDDILVGDLWILAGQSNMEGSAHLQDLEEPSPFVHVMRFSDRWTIASDPLSTPGDAVDPVHWRTTTSTLPDRSQIDFIVRTAGLSATDLVLRKRPVSEEARKALADAGVSWDDFLAAMRPDRGRAEESDMQPGRGAGLGVAFGKRIHAETGVPVGLIMNANGGTTMTQWDPELVRYGGESLYGSMLRRVKLAGGSVAGITWYQGESDAESDEVVDNYSRRMSEFMATLRRDLNDPDLPCIYVQLARVYDKNRNASWWNAIQTQQLAFEKDIPAMWMVPAIEEGMSDHIHVDAIGLRNLGRKMADVALGAVYGKDISGGPRLESATLDADDRQLVRLRFKGANGKLVLRSPIPEFVIRNSDNARQTIESVEIDPNDNDVVMLKLLFPGGEKMRLTYAFGINPATGIADERGLPVPVFGPVTIQTEKAKK